jgi:hypothetical protein
MNYNEFINTYNGKATDYDGVSGTQCIDLAKLYLNKVFGLTPGAWGNAKDYYENFNNISQLKNNFTRIANTASFIPQKGDIAVWGTGLGNTYGHIAIATGEGTTSYFYSYDQNWNGKAMKKVKHTYKGFLGVLRAKDQSKINGGLYRSHVQNIGWQGYASEGEISGTIGKSKRIEAIQINSNEIQYRVHMEGIGWSDWVGNGQIAGTTGESRRIEAIEFKSSKKMTAQGHVQNIGWQNEITGTDITIGTTGKSLRLEAFKLKFV